MFWTVERDADIQAIVDALQGMLDFKLGERVVLLGADPEFRESEQLFFMHHATLLASLSECDVACYPLSSSATLFIA